MSKYTHLIAGILFTIGIALLAALIVRELRGMFSDKE